MWRVEGASLSGEVVAAVEALPVGAVVTMQFAPLGYRHAPKGCRIGFVRIPRQERQTGMSKNKEQDLMQQFFAARKHERQQEASLKSQKKEEQQRRRSGPGAGDGPEEVRLLA